MCRPRTLISGSVPGRLTGSYLLAQTGQAVGTWDRAGKAFGSTQDTSCPSPVQIGLLFMSSVLGTCL